MGTYHPDVWIIVELSGKKVEETYHRILAGWYGGYARGDSWKMSSGITKITDRIDHWEIENTSGSVYCCGKNNEKTSSYTEGIFHHYAKNSNEDISMIKIDISELIKNGKY